MSRHTIPTSANNNIYCYIYNMQIIQNVNILFEKNILYHLFILATRARHVNLLNTLIKDSILCNTRTLQRVTKLPAM